MSDLFGNEKMLALSWKQPFGSAMLIGKIETRVWSTKYRGPVLICLSKTGYSANTTREICGDELFVNMCNKIYPVQHTMNLHGMAIAVGRLVDCREMRQEDEQAAFVKYREPWVEEREGKDGRIRKVNLRLYSHIYQDVRSIEPFPWKGVQGWSQVPEACIRNLKYLSTTTTNKA